MGTIRWCVGALLILGGCTAEAPVASPSVPDDPTEILTAAISYFADRTDVPVAVLDTSFRVETAQDTLTFDPDSLHIYMDFPDSALMLTFIREVPSGYPLPLLDRDDVIRSPAFPRKARIDYSALLDARALGLTRPAVSADGSVAILEYVLNCNAVLRAICGSGGFLILELRDGSWYVVRDEDRWVA